MKAGGIRLIVIVVGFIAFITAPFWLPVATLSVWPTAPEACAELEFKLQQAARCATAPDDWESWSALKRDMRLKKGEGMADATTCPDYIKHARSVLGLSLDDLALTGRVMAEHGVGIGPLWKDVLQLGSFCDHARHEGWID